MKKEEKVIIAGFGGQGVMLMGQILSYAANEEALNTVWIPSYGPETRGGTANCSVTISKDSIHAPVVTHPHTLVALNEPSLNKFQDKIKPGGLLISNKSLIKEATFRDDINVIEIDASQTAIDLGNIKVANMVILGAYLGATKIFDESAIHKVFEKIFTGDKAKLIDLNKQALQAGMAAAGK